MTIGVLSDIHCHEVNSSSIQGGYYHPSMPEVSGTTVNPFSSLSELIRNGEIYFDLLLSPGDYSHQMDPKGLKAAWEQLRLLCADAGSSLLIGTIGNHDVASRESGDVFGHIKSFDTTFPIYSRNNNTNARQHRKDLIEDSFFVQEIPEENLEVYVLNTCHDHWEKRSASRGKIKRDAVKMIKTRLAKNSDCIKVALLHHHPIIHETGHQDTADVLEGSEEFMELSSHFDLIIHGHKHDFRLTRLNNYPHVTSIIGAGSFSCFKTSLKTRAQNNFHLIEFADTTCQDCSNHGQIRTFLFDPTKGWDTRLTIIDGFGCSLTVREIRNKVADYPITRFDHYVKWVELQNAIPQLKYISREESLQVLRLMEETGDISEFIYDQLTLTPKILILK